MAEKKHKRPFNYKQLKSISFVGNEIFMNIFHSHLLYHISAELS